MPGGHLRHGLGRIQLRGRLAPFIELGVGFNPELPARDNVYINAIMLGLTPAEAKARFDSIIEYAELEGFLDLKLKNYSSGMQVRLAFAVMVQVDAEILLIDEVLAVGDAAFQQKCHETLAERRRAGTTILFVTHDMNTVEQVCDRAMLLDRGNLIDLAEPRSIARQYNALNFGRVADGPVRRARAGDGGAAILDAWFEDAHGGGCPCSSRAARVRFTWRWSWGRPSASLPSASCWPTSSGRVFATSTAGRGPAPGSSPRESA